MPADGRSSRPAFQKFAGADFITEFLASPQHSLVFDPEIDVVNNLDHILAKVPGSKLAGKLASLFPVDANGMPRGFDAAGKLIGSGDVYRSRLAPSDLRKLFLAVHDRHYLVVTELHCDVAGFPGVPRREVCQAGFVVRRRSASVPKGKETAVAKEVAKVTRDEADLADLRELDEALKVPGLSPEAVKALRDRQATLASDAGFSSWKAFFASNEKAVEESRAALQAWYRANGIQVAIEGWFPALAPDSPALGSGKPVKPSRTLGAWRVLDAAQQTADPTPNPAKGQVSESVFPLYPLVHDPRDPDHDAAGRTLYYGIVPTSTLMVDADGVPRFDHEMTLEVRCFVRRHCPDCPRGGGRTPDCHGEVVWADATEPYRVAAPFDVQGSSQRPVTIHMPDLRELAAQAARRPRGRQSPVRVVQPQHMSPVPKSGTPGGTMDGPAICFFSIPLITIVALFVLNLFLPIVVFVFNLWFLLVFRFCIKPQISVGVGVDAALAVQPPGLSFDADVDIKLGDTTYPVLDLHNGLKTDLSTQFKAELGELNPGRVDSSLEDLSNDPLVSLHQNERDNATMPADPKEPPPAVDYSAALVYEPHRTPEWRIEGGRG